MVCAVCRLIFAALARILFLRVVQFGFCGEKVALGQVFLQRFLGSLVSIISPMLHILIPFIYYRNCQMFSHGMCN